MNKLKIKKVPFLGAELMAARDNDGQIWAGVRWLCDGIGLSEGQRKRQIANIQADKVLSKGGSNLILNGTGYGNREVLCLKLDFVPLWLAKISITPMMEQETPELAEKLVEYQLKAKDVLASAFLPNATEKPMTDYQRQNVSIQKAKLLNQIASEYDGTYKQVLQAYVTKELTGEFLLPLPTLERKTYSAGEIGEMLGISAKKVGTLANRNNLKTNEYGKWFVDKSPHSSKEVQSFRYYENVVPVLRELV